ncbi:transposase family protein [Streptomyces sp. NPDC057020]|uniref:helix-turn-helix domain-containing protein n=1 Tax=unclassified Streptomyces TaxID=2593676 RepID=UPI0036280498
MIGGATLVLGAPDHVRVVGNGSRAAIISDRRITGLSADVIAELVAEVGRLWHERHQARLKSRPRKRAVGAGAKHLLVFVDRLLAALVHLRHGVTHDVPACWSGVDRSTITRAIGEVRPLLAERGCTVANGIRLRTLADFAEHHLIASDASDLFVEALGERGRHAAHHVVGVLVEDGFVALRGLY